MPGSYTGHIYLAICELPNVAGLLAHHLLTRFATEGFGEVVAVLHYADHAEASRRVRVRLHLLTKSGVGLVLTPDLAVADEESLLRSETVDCLRVHFLSAAFSRFGLLCLHIVESAHGDTNSAVVGRVLAQREPPANMNIR